MIIQRELQLRRGFGLSADENNCQPSRQKGTINCMIDCTFEDGNTNNLRHVTVACIVVKDNGILLARRSQRLSEGGKWGLPGGFMDKDETSLQTAKREVKEETGWDIDNLQLFGINDNPVRPGSDRQTIDFIYVGEATTDSGQHDDETEELAWFPLTQLPSPEDIAFDHLDSITLYINYRREPFTLPVIYTHDMPSIR